MPTIHVVMKKEELEPDKLHGKVAVIFDVLLATSAMVLALAHGAREVIPARNRDDARAKAAGRAPGSFLLAGEERGEGIEGFLHPARLWGSEVRGKSVILTTTNGTVAVLAAASAKQVYIGSLVNAPAVAGHLLQEHRNDTIILVCSGSGGAFNLEDFYGAGCLLDGLLSGGRHPWELTDAALATLFLYQGWRHDSREVLGSTRVGRMMVRAGYSSELDRVAKQGGVPLVPVAEGGTIRVVQEEDALLIQARRENGDESAF